MSGKRNLSNRKKALDPKNIDYSRLALNVTHDNRYPALDKISGFFKFLGYLYIIAGIIGTIFFLSQEKSYNYFLQCALPGIITALVSAFTALMSFAISEAIKVFTDLATDTHMIRNKLERSNI